MVKMLTWFAAIAVATSLGLAAVGVVGDAVRDEGPLGQAVTRTDQGGAASSTETPAGPDPATETAAGPDPAGAVHRALTGEYGTFGVSCEGPYARGLDASPETADGWRVVRFEPGPDDDVEVVFASRTEYVEIEVFCNAGRPEVAELERSRVGDDD